ANQLTRAAAIDVVLNLFDFLLKPFTVFVHHYRDADKEAFVAQRMLPTVPSVSFKHPPDLSITLAAEVACKGDLRVRFIGHGVASPNPGSDSLVTTGQHLSVLGIIIRTNNAKVIHRQLYGETGDRACTTDPEEVCVCWASKHYEEH